MINADQIFARWQRHADALAAPVRSISLPKFGKTFEDRAYQMAVVNFSRDSSYRESVVFSHILPGAHHCLEEKVLDSHISHA